MYITYDIWMSTFIFLCTDNFSQHMITLNRTIAPAIFVQSLQTILGYVLYNDMSYVIYI